MKPVAGLPLIAGAVAFGVLTAGCSNAGSWHTVASADSHAVGHIVVSRHHMLKACLTFRDQVIPQADTVGISIFTKAEPELLPLLGHRRVDWSPPSDSRAPLVQCYYQAHRLAALRSLDVAQHRSDNEFVSAVDIDNRGGWIPGLYDPND
jgi:hypothetical protein